MASRGRVVGVWLVLAVGVLAAAGGAHGQESLSDVLKPRLTRIQLDELMMATELSRDQRMIVNMLFTDYDDGIARLIEETDALADEYGRQEVQAAFAGRLHLPQAELNQKRRDVLTVYAEALPEADYLLDNLLTSIESILMSGQQGAYQRAVRELKRALLFAPLRADEMSYDYAGDGIDLAELLGQAMAPGNELDGLDPQRIGETLTWYEQQLETVLVRAFAAHRDAAIQRRIANIGRGVGRAADVDGEFIDNWKPLFDLNRSAVNAIAEAAAAELGAESARQWRARFDAAVYPWLYRPRKPDRIAGWLEREADLAPDVAGQIRSIYADYAAARDALVDEATALMLDARLEFGVIIHSMSDPSSLATTAERALYQDLLRNSGELSKLDADAVKETEALLNDGERKSLDRYLRSRRS